MIIRVDSSNSRCVSSEVEVIHLHFFGTLCSHNSCLRKKYHLSVTGFGLLNLLCTRKQSYSHWSLNIPSIKDVALFEQ